MTKRGRSKKIGVLKNSQEIKRKSKCQIHDIDREVGQRLRIARNAKGVSQGQLGKAVGLTFQQIQKYERGVNRISCSRLWEFSKLLDVKMSYFFDNADDGEELLDNQQISLLAAFNKVKDKATAISVVRTLGENSDV